MQTSDEIERVVRAAEALRDYPRAVTMMFEAGILGYVTDVPTHELVYRCEHATWLETGDRPVPQDEPAGQFSLDAAKAAIASYGRGETDYNGFLAKLWRAGVVTYEVDLAARTVTYSGANGESHVRVVPALL